MNEHDTQSSNQIWPKKLAEQIVAKQKNGDIIIETGTSPSGKYHFGFLRELITADAVCREIKKLGRVARHIDFVDDLDGLRKVPAGVDSSYEKYLGKPLCDIPAPDGSNVSYAQYHINGLLETVKALGIEMEFIYSHQKYRAGFFVPAIEKVLENVETAKRVLAQVSGRKLDEHWSPIQINEDGYLKNRRYVSMDKTTKTITYLNPAGEEQTTKYDAGEVKLDWRLDWPARWWLLKITAEPFGRDHSTKGGSYDTGQALMHELFNAPPPVPIPFDFVNRAGDPKKMSSSRGTGIEAAEAVRVLPAEVIRFFMLRFDPSKRLYFDPVDGVVRLVDEFAELFAKENKTEQEEDLLELCTAGLEQPTVSRVPFSHLVASYQAALKDKEKTLEVISRTEHAQIVAEDRDIILRELDFIDQWLANWAPDDVKFELVDSVDPSSFSDQQKELLNGLADRIEKAPEDADGEWFHAAIYEAKVEANIEPKEVFSTLYQALIGQNSGPRAGWFLTILPRDWLIARLRLEK